MPSSYSDRDVAGVSHISTESISVMSDTILEIPAKRAGFESIKRSPSALPEGPSAISGRQAPWVLYMSLGLTFLLFLGSWWFYISLTCIKGQNGSWHEILAGTYRPLDILLMESYRWSALSALFVFAFFTLLSLASALPGMTSRAPVRIRAVGAIVGNLKYRISFFLASLFLFVCYHFSGLSNQIGTDIFKGACEATTGSTGSASSNESVIKGVMRSIDVGLSEIGYIVVQHIYTFRPVLLRVPIFMLVLSFALLAEKLVVWNISRVFHKSFYTDRIRTNNVVLNCIEALLRRFPSKTEARSQEGDILTDEQIGALSERIYHGLLEPGSKSLSLADFQAVLSDRPETLVLFEYLDSNQNNDLTLDELKEAIQEAYSEKFSLVCQLKANEKVVRNLDYLFMFCVCIVLSLILLPSINFDLFTLVALISGSLTILRASFSDIFGQIVQALIFVLVTHPFDIGDRIGIDGKHYIVSELGLWTTKLTSTTGRVVYVTNVSIQNAVFQNYRRSDVQDDTVSV